MNQRIADVGFPVHSHRARHLGGQSADIFQRMRDGRAVMIGIAADLLQPGLDPVDRAFDGCLQIRTVDTSFRAEQFAEQPHGEPGRV